MDNFASYPQAPQAATARNPRLWAGSVLAQKSGRSWCKLKGLPTQTVTKAEPCDIWRVRPSAGSGQAPPPGELVPDLDDWGPELYPDTVDEVYEEDDMRGFFDDEPEPGLAA